jgi:IS30 family transposase
MKTHFKSNTIGLIKRFLPKGIDLRKIEAKRVKEVENLNTKHPIKYSQKKLHLSLAFRIDLK